MCETLSFFQRPFTGTGVHVTGGNVKEVEAIAVEESVCETDGGDAAVGEERDECVDGDAPELRGGVAF